MTTEVIHIRDRQPGDIYIGRGGHGESGYFGNPFLVGRDGTREEVLLQFQAYFLVRVAHDPDYRKAVKRLRDKRLVCFCKPKACHGDILAKYADRR